MATTGNGQPALLNGDLYEQDPEHDDYLGVANTLVMQRQGSVPTETVRGIANSHLADIASQAGWSRQFEHWERDLDESFRTAFIISQAEDWSDLRRDELEAVIEESYGRANELRELVGSGAVEREDFNTWISVLLLGFVHEGDEWESLIDYVETRGAFERIESVGDVYEMVGRHLAKVKDGDSEAWESLDDFAWRDGIFLAVLQRTGILQAPKAGSRSLRSEVPPQQDPRSQTR